MAIDKKYYWLKMKDDFFHQKKIKALMINDKSGKSVIIYLKLLLLSIKENSRNNDYELGYVKYDNLVDTFAGEIGLQIDEDENTVKKSINELIKNKLLVEVSDEKYFIPDIYRYVGNEEQNWDKIKLIRNSENLFPKEEIKTPLTNCQRQQRYKAKKACQQKDYIKMISDDENHIKYNGIYYLTIKKYKFKCSQCGSRDNLDVIGLIQEGEKEEVTEDNAITVCSSCYQELVLLGLIDENSAIAKVSIEGNEDTEIDLELEKDLELELEKE